jgi:integrase
MWVLAASTGVRRSELAGVERDTLDLNQGTVTIENTRVVVKGHATDSGGKTESSRRTISLGPFTVAALHRLVVLPDLVSKSVSGTALDLTADRPRTHVAEISSDGRQRILRDSWVRRLVPRKTMTGAGRANAAATGKLASTRPRSRRGIADRGKIKWQQEQ